MANLREQVAAILCGNFPEWIVTADDVRPVTGYWKSQDVYRWEVHPRLKATGETIRYYGCWETMMEFVKDARKNGCYIRNGLYEIEANGI